MVSVNILSFRQSQTGMIAEILAQVKWPIKLFNSQNMIISDLWFYILNVHTFNIYYGRL